MSGPRRRQLSLDAYIEGVLAGDRAVLARAITLVESRRSDHRRTAEALLTRLLPHTGGSWRIGITGVPGVGKSTFIDELGTQLTGQGRRVAVLAVDPSSSRTGGSILGDKTRMNRLSLDPAAFVRPSPTSGTLGGGASRTRETLLLVEAAGFDVVLVETVGVGQSETLVARMTDFFLVLMLPGAGDELQGIKRGLLELADLIAVNKADVDPDQAQRSARNYASALHYLRPVEPDWKPRVVTCSGQEAQGLEAIWALVTEHRQTREASGRLAEIRRQQSQDWLDQLVQEHLGQAFAEHPAVQALRASVRARVGDGTLAAPEGARALLDAFFGS